ncbi:MAG: hypothetical protein K1X53_12775 [Candidatus Sumerlaeaceae bacterium]|nr:hypothetical protein [Candidatus Sumerlaeaceae bacterium]
MKRYPILCSLTAVLVFVATLAARAETVFRFDASSTSGPMVSRMLYGMNVARWDHDFFSSSTAEMLLSADRDAIAKLKALNPGFLKYPGGNDADSYVWNDAANPTADMDTEEFLGLARACNAPGFFTVNFTKPPALAAEWVRFTNTLGGRRGTVPYWEVGDEVWGHWAKSHVDGATYGKKFRSFARAMRAVDPNLQLAANLSLNNSDTTWTREALKSLGDSFNVITLTYFPQSPPTENDKALLVTADKYRQLFRRLDQFVADARPGKARPKYCLVGFNSTSTKPGPQTVEMVTAVFMAQMYGAMAEVGTDMACWWAFRNAYPPRGGDYGILASDGRNTPHYTYWVLKLLSNHFHGRLIATGRSNGLEFYAVATEPGKVSVLLINTVPDPVKDVRVEWAGFSKPTSLSKCDFVTSATTGQNPDTGAQAPKGAPTGSGYEWPEIPGYGVGLAVIGEEGKL